MTTKPQKLTKRTLDRMANGLMARTPVRTVNLTIAELETRRAELIALQRKHPACGVLALSLAAVGEAVRVRHMEDAAFERHQELVSFVVETGEEMGHC